MTISDYLLQFVSSKIALFIPMVYDLVWELVLYIAINTVCVIVLSARSYVPTIQLYILNKFIS